MALHTYLITSTNLIILCDIFYLLDGIDLPTNISCHFEFA